MGDLTKDFSEYEFRCKGERCCGGVCDIDPRLVAGLQSLRDLVGAALRVSSGYRCSVHNMRVGGSKSSQHVKGLAADIIPPPGWTPEGLAEMAERVDCFKKGGIGIYKSGWIHLDIRPNGPVRWKA